MDQFWICGVSHSKTEAKSDIRRIMIDRVDTNPQTSERSSGGLKLGSQNYVTVCRQFFSRPQGKETRFHKLAFAFFILFPSRYRHASHLFVAMVKTGTRNPRSARGVGKVTLELARYLFSYSNKRTSSNMSAAGFSCKSQMNEGSRDSLGVKVLVDTEIYS